MTWSHYFNELVTGGSIDDLRGDIASAAGGVLADGLPDGATVEITGYFNHSFVPDLVVSSSEGGVTRRRNVYLRFDERVCIDAPIEGEDSPLIIGMRLQVEEAGYMDADSLILSAAAFDLFEQDWSPRDKSESAGFQAVAFGAGGYVGRANAESVSESLKDVGLALQGKKPADVINTALSVVGSLTSERVAREYGKTLFERWIRAGRDIRGFPGPSPDEILLRDGRADLLATMIDSGRTFTSDIWASIGASVSLRSLLGLMPMRSRTSVAEAVGPLASHWVGSVARVRRSVVEQRSSVLLIKESAKLLGFLRFVLPSMTVDIASDGRAFARPVPDQTLPTVDALASVLGARETQGVDVGARLQIDLPGYQDVNFEEIYRQTVGQSAGDFRIQKLKALTPGTAHMVAIDFATGIVTPSGESTPVPALIRSAVRYFGATDADLQALSGWGITV